MTLTTIPAIATGNVWTAAQWTTYFKDNGNDLIGMANGTIPFVGATQKFANDANVSIGKSSNIITLTLDSGDNIYFNRSTNTFYFSVGNVEKFAVDGDGNIQLALVEIGEATITNGSTANMAHGFSTTPRLVFGRYNTVTGDSGRTRVISPGYIGPASSVRMTEVGGTNVVVINNTGATVYAKVWALR